jgi:lysine/ornithine N-monooxygenase
VRQATFDPEFADAWLSLKKEDRKKIVAKGAVTKESVKAFVNSPKTPAITKGKTK